MDELTWFRDSFKALTCVLPFPWQEDLYMAWFSAGQFPQSCNLPTGLGKTSVVAVWLLARAKHPELMPRRLVYVVNRRTVVDQTTEEVTQYRRRLDELDHNNLLKRELQPLAISTLRGQFADNREWSADPSRPAVIVGTVDMIGSRLLFNGYGVGFKGKPLHAGFLGQDVLLVHDEAHLEPAFQRLIETIRDEQKKESAPFLQNMQLKVIELTATSRAAEKPFELTDREKTPEDVPEIPTEPIHFVWQRLQSKKKIKFHAPDKEKVSDRIGKLAKEYSKSHPGSAVLVFVNSLEDHDAVCKALEGERVQVLTGTLRGLERDRMANPRKETGCPIFARFLKPPRPNDKNSAWKITPAEGTVYLVCTSAGEVGIDISADHMVCDLVPYDRMIQRFGRVNRFGQGDASIEIVHEAKPNTKKENDLSEKARWATLDLLKELPQVDDRWSASPLALLPLRRREDLRLKFESAYTPRPTILPTTDILFDSWALTTIRGRLPGRPPVESYLHGLSGWESPETYVAWREEVGVITGELLKRFKPEVVLEDYPLKPHELLRDRSDRVFKQVCGLAEQHPQDPVWLLDGEGSVWVFRLEELADKVNKDRLNYRTLLLPPYLGGLRNGILDGESNAAEDVADKWGDENGKRRRVRVWENDSEFDVKVKDLRLIRTINTKPDLDENEEEGEATGSWYWHWYELPKSADNEGSKTAAKAVEWGVHTDDVVKNVTRIVKGLRLTDGLTNALVLAAKFHDLGKKRLSFQRALGNIKADILLAKSGKKKQPFDLRETCRHEFSSLLEVELNEEFKGLNDPDIKDLIRHLIATHHGRGRPHFEPDEFDAELDLELVEKTAAEVPQRYARLQRKYGRWGLAYLESLLRAADWAASANPSEFLEDHE
jgi:CRISPR-associated endonuclease/helicase Cas3